MFLANGHFYRSALEKDKDSGPMFGATVAPPHTSQGKADGGRSHQGAILALVRRLHQHVSGGDTQVHLSYLTCNSNTGVFTDKYIIIYYNIYYNYNNNYKQATVNDDLNLTHHHSTQQRHHYLCLELPAGHQHFLGLYWSPWQPPVGRCAVKCVPLSPAVQMPLSVAHK